MAQSGDNFILPDLHAVFPFKGSRNPLFDVVGKESREWADSYEILPHDRHARFTSTYGELLASYAYPYAPRDAFRVCADFVNILFTLDEVSDTQDADGARETIHLFVRVLRNDPDCDDGSPLAKMLIRSVATYWFTPHDFPWIDSCLKFYGKAQESRDSELPTPFPPRECYVYGGCAKGGRVPCER